MNKRLYSLQEQYMAAVASAKEILEASAGREMTEDEEKDYEDLDATMTRLEKEMSREKKLEELDRKSSSVEIVKDAVDKAAEKAVEESKEQRFESFGEQLQAVVAAEMNKGQGYDPRLVWQAAASGANVSVPSEGGFLIQQDFSERLLDLMHDMGEVVSRVERVPLSGNSIKLPYVDETSRADGSRFGGVRGYWADEAGTVTATKPAFGSMELSLKKLFGLAYATDEMLADAAALERILTLAFTEEMVFKTEDGIINGSGAGQPLGILNSGALVTQAKETGQTAATIVTNNVLKMWARMPVRNTARAVWLINTDCQPQLYPLTLGTGTAVSLLYTPPAPGSVYGQLLGRPVIPVEYCATVGTAGDIILADLGSYLLVDKGGVDRATSMHIRFLYDEQAFRIIYRVDGQPMVKSALTPFKGTNTLSPFIALAVRA